MKLLLRLYSFIFHLPLAFLLFAIGAFGLIDGAYNMNIDFLPWSGKTLVYTLAGIGFVGLLSVYQAIKGKMKFLFALYALIVLVLAVNGVLFSGHRYADANAFYWALAYVAGAFVAFIGALTHMRG
ncbi:MAG: hypothetical protein HY820_18590 [Acidobacteria bacterium]|nr:hypothetical protein [Acidobacteriota bacterium]